MLLHVNHKEEIVVYIQILHDFNKIVQIILHDFYKRVKLRWALASTHLQFYVAVTGRKQTLIHFF